MATSAETVMAASGKTKKAVEATHLGDVTIALRLAGNDMATADREIGEAAVA